MLDLFVVALFIVPRKSDKSASVYHLPATCLASREECHLAVCRTDRGVRHVAAVALRVARQVGVVQNHGLADGGGLALSAHRTVVDRDGGASKLSHENHDDADEQCAANVPSTQSSRARLPAKKSN